MQHAFLNNPTHRSRLFFLTLLAAYGVLSIASDPVFAVTVERLQEPIRALKNDIFGGWMMAVKICAAAAGIIMSAFRGSLAPFGIGAGLSMGIHLYDQYLGNGADGALI